MQRELQRQVVTPAASAGRQAGDRAGEGFHRGYAGWIGRIAALTATIGVGTAIEKIVSTGVKGAANLETLRTSFASLLGSAKAANDEIVSLQAFAAKTPFSQQDVFGYAQQYLSLANSIGLAKDQVQPFLTTIGDIGAVTGASSENIHNAVLAIGQIGSAGKVTLDNLNQISEAFPGFNGAAAIASATGQTTAQVMKEIGSGAIDAQTGVQALLKGMQDFPGAAGAMEKQAKTLSGVWSTFKDTIQISLTQAFQPLIPTIKTVLSDLTPVISSALNQFAPAITRFAQQIVPLLQPLITGFSTAFTAVFDALGPALAALAPVIQPLANAFAQLVRTLSPLVTFAAQVIAQVGPPLLAIFQNLLTVLQPVVAVLVSSLQPVLPIITKALADVAQALAPVAGVLGQALAQVITAIAPSLPSIATSFAQIAVSLAEVLRSLAPVVALLTKFSALGLGEMLKALAPQLQAVAKGFGFLSDTVSGVVSGLTSLLGGDKLAPLVGGVGGLGAAADLTGSSLITMTSNALQAKIVLAQLGLGAQVTADDIRSVTEQIAAMAQATAAARGQAALALGLAAVAKAKAAAADAAKGSQLPSLNIPAINVPKIGGAGSAKPQFDVSTLTSFLSTAGITKNPLTEALNSILESAKAAGKKLSSGLVNLLKSQNSDLIGLTNQRDRIAQRLQSAQQKLADLVSQRKQESDAIKGAVTDTFSLGNIPKPQFGEPLTLRDILRRLSTAVSNAKQFGSILRKLAREGLSPVLLSQLAEAGPDALPAAKALLSATPKQLRSINSQFKELTQTGSSIGKFVSGDMFNAGVDSARGLVKGLQSQQSALNKAIRALAKSMVKELRDTLGIHSPSTVLHQLGAFSGEGFARGLESTVERVRSSADKLANGALPRSQAAAWSLSAGAGGSRGDVTVNQYIQNPVPEPVSVSSPAGIRRAAYALGR